MLTCINCNKTFSTYVIIDGKSRNLCNRKRCLECQPWKAPRYPVRTEQEKHKKMLEKSKRYYLKKTKEDGINPVANRNKKRKNALLKILGNTGCLFCGYKRCNRALAFHHCFGKENKLDCVGMGKDLEYIYRELRKCVLVCHNCHCEIHDKLLDTRQKFGIFQQAVKKLKGKKWSDIMVP